MTPSGSRRQRLIVGITGATGALYGIRTLQRAREFDLETHLVVSVWGARTIEHETTHSVAEVRAMADVVHKPSDQAATISSGSFITAGMVIAPCSVKTLGAIANGFGGHLISRAADVTLKERRRLVLLVRESPLTEIHLENMLTLTRMGASIAPPMPAYYNHPTSIEDLIDHTVTRTFDQLGLHSDAGRRWDGRLDAPT